MKIILAIETSCDETGIAVVQGSGRTKPVIKVLADVIASQIAIHKKYGGVVPHLAAREHQRNLIPALHKALREAKLLNSKIKTQNAKLQFKIRNVRAAEAILAREPELAKKFLSTIVSEPIPQIDYIAVTKGPGLSPALWTGINFAKALALLWHKPLLGIDHMEGHLSANFINEISGISNFQFPISKTSFPILCLTVSGGHTQLVLARDWAQFELLGETVDDAAGEAFDKVARMLELSYPGGPEISKLAKNGNPKAFPFPRPMLSMKNYLFSFSGLKTAVLYTLKKIEKITPEIKQDIAASFQQAIVDVLVKKTISAAKEYNAKTIMLAGGVAANQELRNKLRQAIEQNLPNTIYKIPNTNLCTDNGAMIGAAAYIRLATQKLYAKAGLAQKDFDVRPIEAEPARLITDN
ncbi:MAG: tRNA (adenosine(37)-N6)-threonylcarbamoyltransferase complex transferase subunit TsaD [Candidatus Spechtbacteria bacterium]|nr:tRNA (adenosine(37)-N6)-threonylcarbamoyltransferase complex transferase subunit TsaD [Candidatus Spechtbacteria bacterium]